VNPSPIAFMSYVRADDDYERGKLTELRMRLSGEVAAQSGESFPIFQDREDIGWGQQWQERIDESIDSITFLIPVLTPRFFRSDACRAELERFLRREQELRRGDLILPVYYIDAPILNDPSKRGADALAKVIYGRQYWDWRPLRFKSLDSEQISETIAGMAAKIIMAVERPATTATLVSEQYLNSGPKIPATSALAVGEAPYAKVKAQKRNHADAPNAERDESSSTPSPVRGPKTWPPIVYVGAAGAFLAALAGTASQIPPAVDAITKACIALGLCGKPLDCKDFNNLSAAEWQKCLNRS
jgi:hypothetical protein